MLGIEPNIIKYWEFNLSDLKCSSLPKILWHFFLWQEIARNYSYRFSSFWKVNSAVTLNKCILYLDQSIQKLAKRKSWIFRRSRINLPLRMWWSQHNRAYGRNTQLWPFRLVFHALSFYHNCFKFSSRWSRTLQWILAINWRESMHLPSRFP